MYDVSSHPCFFSSITKNNSFVVGVMAIDISITHFHQLLTDSYPICKEFSTRFVNSFRLSFVKEYTVIYNLDCLNYFLYVNESFFGDSQLFYL